MCFNAINCEETHSSCSHNNGCSFFHIICICRYNAVMFRLVFFLPDDAYLNIVSHFRTRCFMCIFVGASPPDPILMNALRDKSRIVQYGDVSADTKSTILQHFRNFMTFKKNRAVTPFPAHLVHEEVELEAKVHEPEVVYCFDSFASHRSKYLCDRLLR
jgi:hypothetical protein